MKIYMMGDSTMRFNNYFRYPQTGWGQILHMFVKNGVLIDDQAENGRSTKSFIAEGRFDKILNSLVEGDYVICQFGHNDEKIADPNRYTAPYGEYQENLKFIAKEVEKRGCHVVFATSITRHKFENGVCCETHGEYPKAMMEMCKENGYTCIDLNHLTKELYTKVGEEESKKYHMIFPANTYKLHPEAKDDHSHLVFNGAFMVCELFVRALAKTNDKMNECFLDLSEKEEIDYNMLID